MERQVGVTMKYDPMFNSAKEIVQQTFDRSPVISYRLMHELRQLVYCVGSIRSSQGKILETTNNDPILCQIL